MFNAMFRSRLTCAAGLALALLLPAVAVAGQVRTVSSGIDRTVFRVSIAPDEIEELLAASDPSLRGSGALFASPRPAFGAEQAFSVASLVAVPGQAAVRAEAIPLDSLILALPLEVEWAGEHVSTDLVDVGPPAIMRDLRVVEVRVNAARRDPEREQLVVYTQVEVTLGFEGGGANPAAERVRRPCEAFDAVYRACVANYEPPDQNLLELGGYLIISIDQFKTQMEPFAEWKARQGYDTHLVGLSDIGPSPTKEEIRDYIADAYETWDPAPTYVLLVGDVPGMPAFHHTYGADTDVTDHQYSMLDGDDYFPDLFVGRLSVASQNELSTILAKLLSYEANPYLGNTDWYERALLVAGNFTPTELNPITMRLTKLWVRDLLLENGYAEVDTVFYPPTTSPDLIRASINEGVGIVNYRGWADASGWHFPEFYVDDLYGLSNGFKLPIMTSIVCATGDFENSHNGYVDCFGEIWLKAGTQLNPKGGASFIGCSYLHSRTAPNNAIDAGIYWGLFVEDVTALGPMMLCGKMTLYNSFPQDRLPGGSVEMYFHTYNILGDPSLDVWTSVPETLSVIHPDTIPLGSNVVPVQVTDAGGPVEGAWVCVYREGETRAVRRTDELGLIELEISPPTGSPLAITVTGHDALPYQGTIEVEQEDYFVGYQSHAIDDDGLGESQGNGDGEVNPGETIELLVTLKNSGTQPVQGVSAAISTNDEWVTVTDSLEDYGDIPAGASLLCADDFGFSVDPACTSGHLLRFDLEVEDGAQRSWSSLIEIFVGSSRLRYVGISVDDTGQPNPNGYLDPGEEVELSIDLLNSGLADALGVEGVLRLAEEGFTVIDSTGTFGTIAVGDTVNNVGDPFIVSASDTLSDGYWTQAYLALTTSEGWSELVQFVLYLSEPQPSLFTGPDPYGYFAYDTEDQAFGECPTYEWIEIDTAYGGSGTNLGLHDDWTVTVDLPFAFTFYGATYNRLSICSNGWLSLDDTNWIGFRNWDIANPLGPKTLIDAYWDDLDPDSAGAVFSYHDTQNGRFIVEWSRVYNNQTETFHTFEAILYDPADWPTGTGDGEILFQYHTIDDPSTSTIGIERRNVGIEYLYNGQAPPTATTIGESVAVKFTTDPPFALPVGVEGETDPSLVPRTFALSQPVPNPSRGQATIAFALPGGDGRGRNHVSLKVYNIQGQLVRNLTLARVEPGYHTVLWDGRDASGRAVASGLYFCRMEVRDFRAARKIVLLR